MMARGGSGRPGIANDGAGRERPGPARRRSQRGGPRHPRSRRLALCLRGDSVMMCVDDFGTELSCQCQRRSAPVPPHATGTESSVCRSAPPLNLLGQQLGSLRTGSSQSLSSIRTGSSQSLSHPTAFLLLLLLLLLFLFRAIFSLPFFALRRSCIFGESR